MSYFAVPFYLREFKWFSVRKAAQLASSDSLSTSWGHQYAGFLEGADMSQEKSAEPSWWLKLVTFCCRWANHEESRWVDGGESIPRVPPHVRSTADAVQWWRRRCSGGIAAVTMVDPATVTTVVVSLEWCHDSVGILWWGKSCWFCQKGKISQMPLVARLLFLFVSVIFILWCSVV